MSMKCGNLTLKKDIYCDLIKDEFGKYKDSGFLIPDYKPCFHADNACVQYTDTQIGLNINENKIECTELDLSNVTISNILA